MSDFVVIIALLGITFLTGTVWKERSHLKRLEKEEEEFHDIIIISASKIDFTKYQDAQLVASSLVMSADYFRRFVFNIVTLFGGNVAVFNTLMERSRREAVIRLKKQARDIGSHLIVNLRFETATLQKRHAQGSTGMIEFISYGTAVK